MKGYIRASQRGLGAIGYKRYDKKLNLSGERNCLILQILDLVFASTVDCRDRLTVAVQVVWAGKADHPELLPSPADVPLAAFRAEADQVNADLEKLACAPRVRRQ